jgi:hypothetical protein
LAGQYQSLEAWAADAKQATWFENLWLWGGYWIPIVLQSRTGFNHIFAKIGEYESILWKMLNNKLEEFIDWISSITAIQPWANMA